MEKLKRTIMSPLTYAGRHLKSVINIEVMPYDVEKILIRPAE